MYIYRETDISSDMPFLYPAGIWAPIRGVVGVSSDLKTVLIAYEQNETPGLGARIAEPVSKTI